MLLYSLGFFFFLKCKSFLYALFFRKQKKIASYDSSKYLDSVFSAIFPLIFLFFFFSFLQKIAEKSKALLPTGQRCTKQVNSCVSLCLEVSTVLRKAVF